MALTIRDPLRGEGMSAVAKRQRTSPDAALGVSDLLLDWYDRERRDLPWRMAPGKTADPYRVWLSEIMLQQTTVKAVVPYYAKFLARWPTVRHLAESPIEDVLAAWAGLGYYSRARNLHAAAVAVVSEHGGRFPATEEGLRSLPGVGPYTAAAIAAIAFGEPATPVDGNVERVVARLFAVTETLPKAKRELKRLAATLTPARRAGDFAQAMMDLGATVCTPKRPSCLMCPIRGACAAKAKGIAAQLPARAVKGERPVRRGIAFVALREDGYVLLRRRPEEGLLARMMEVPTTEWGEAWLSADEALGMAPVKGAWWPVPAAVIHTFTHFRLELMVYRAVVAPETSLTFFDDPARCRWVARRDLHGEALPSLMRKVIAHALDTAD